MPYHRLKLEIAGQSMYGIAFSTEAELEAFLAGRDLAPITPLPPPPVSERPVRPRGRPSFDLALARAVKDLGPRLDLGATLAERARIVLRHIAEHAAPDSMLPGRSTVETFLASKAVPRKSPRKSPNKSTRGKLRRAAGGKPCSTDS